MVKKETTETLAKYLAMVKKVDPELFEIKEAIIETKLNPIYIPAIIRAIANLYYGTGHGKVQIFMQEGKITSINPEERLKVDIEAVLNEPSV